MNNKKIFVIVGAKWFDKVNGNTYHNAKIIETDTNNIYYTGYSYGYGDSYKYDAKKYIVDILGVKDFQIIDAGCFYISKKNIKNELF